MFSHALGDGAKLAMLEPWHASQFLAAFARHRDYLKRAIPAAHSVLTIDDAREYLQRWADGHAADTQHMTGIWLDGAYVGCVQLFDFDARLGTCEMGVWLVPEAQGRGLVTRACRYVLDWAIGVRGMSRVQWKANPVNAASVAVARRLGMTRDGRLRSAWQIGGVRSDVEVWSMLAHEWPKAVP
jgi:RimJ/RimL family protein N-acetyltransferase